MPTYKNLRSPRTNLNETEAEPLCPIPLTPDPRVNDERINTTRDGDAPIRWPAPRTLPEARPPMKLR
jgi:hypothetical protein